MCIKKDYPGNKHIKFFKSVNIPSQTFIHTDQPGSKTANEDRKKNELFKTGANEHRKRLSAKSSSITLVNTKNLISNIS